VEWLDIKEQLDLLHNAKFWQQKLPPAIIEEVISYLHL
jgi:hypothetical protein